MSSAPPLMPASALRSSLELANLGLLDYPDARIELQAQTDDAARALGRPHEQWRRMALAKEPFTKNFIEAMGPGSVFYDIGANVGSYTLLAATRGTFTVAIEPATTNQHALWQNVLLNHLDERVVRIQAALGTANGWCWLGYRDMQSGSADFLLGDPKLMFTHRLEIIHKEQVRCWRLDDLVASSGLVAPTHLKLDVDGAELAVLQGAEGLLTESPLRAMMVELQPDAEAGITEYLAGLGWDLAERFPVRGIAYAEYRKLPKVVAKAKRVRKRKAA
jgi:FkbM family methyltransferase